jgi:hypothetical protein
MEGEIIIGDKIQFDQLQILKEISGKMDDLNREMREIKVRLNDINK